MPLQRLRDLAVRDGGLAVPAAGQRLKASFTFALASFMLPLDRSPRPATRIRRLPVSRPTIFLRLPLIDSVLCARLLAVFIAG